MKKLFFIIGLFLNVVCMYAKPCVCRTQKDFIMLNFSTNFRFDVASSFHFDNVFGVMLSVINKKGYGGYVSYRQTPTVNFTNQFNYNISNVSIYSVVDKISHFNPNVEYQNKYSYQRYELNIGFVGKIINEMAYSHHYYVGAGIGKENLVYHYTLLKNNSTIDVQDANYSVSHSVNIEGGVLSRYENWSFHLGMSMIDFSPYHSFFVAGLGLNIPY